MVTYIPNDISLFPMEGLLIPVSKFLIFVFCISLLHFLLRGQNRIDIVTQIRILCMPSFILKKDKIRSKKLFYLINCKQITST